VLEHSLALSTLWYDNKSLAQELALMEWRIRQLEAQIENMPEPRRLILHPDFQDPAPEEEILESAL
jgi:hypothetical protein